MDWQLIISYVVSVVVFFLVVGVGCLISTAPPTDEQKLYDQNMAAALKQNTKEDK